MVADTAVRARKSDSHPRDGHDVFSADRLITGDGIERARHVLTPGDYTIGRNADFPIRVDADLIPRQHAKLILTSTTRSSRIAAAATARA